MTCLYDIICASELKKIFFISDIAKRIKKCKGVGFFAKIKKPVIPLESKEFTSPSRGNLDFVIYLINVQNALCLYPRFLKKVRVYCCYLCSSVRPKNFLSLELRLHLKSWPNHFLGSDWACLADAQ